MSSRFPRTTNDGNTDTFMGLAPSTQEAILEYCISTAQTPEDVIRYISRNVKTSRS